MIPVQAAIGGKIIARETIKGFKKDVLTKILAAVQLTEKGNCWKNKKKGKRDQNNLVELKFLKKHLLVCLR